jgi:hypothetical protein
MLTLSAVVTTASSDALAAALGLFVIDFFRG